MLASWICPFLMLRIPSLIPFWKPSCFFEWQYLVCYLFRVFDPSTSRTWFFRGFAGSQFPSWHFGISKGACCAQSLWASIFRWGWPQASSSKRSSHSATSEWAWLRQQWFSCVFLACTSPSQLVPFPDIAFELGVPQHTHLSLRRMLEFFGCSRAQMKIWM